MRSRCLALGPDFPPYLVLLRVGFTLPPPLLPARCALTAPFHPYHCVGQTFGRAMNSSKGLPRAAAVCFLWHWPSVRLHAHVPDVIRHTALRSSDFPLPAPALAETGSDRPVLLPEISLPRKQSYQLRLGVIRVFLRFCSSMLIRRLPEARRAPLPSSRATPVHRPRPNPRPSAGSPQSIRARHDSACRKSGRMEWRGIWQ